MNCQPDDHTVDIRKHAFCLSVVVLLSVGMAASAVEAAPSQLGPQQYSCQDPGVQDTSACDRSCRQAVGDALAAVYYRLKGGTATDNVWLNVDNPCMDCSPNPSYCCWPGVYCCSESEHAPAGWGHPGGCSSTSFGSVHQLVMRGFNLSGSLADDVVEHLAFLTRHGLHTLDLSSNRLTGTIPASIGRLTSLTTINIGNNELTGELPVTFSNLTRLQHFYASFNRLSGPLAGRFCTQPDSPLSSLIMRANDFRGTVDLTACTGLGLLDLADNRFHGALPVGRSNQQLIRLRAINNLFNESIPDDIWRLPLLSTIDLTNNDLTGTLSPYMGSTYNIVYIRLGNNSLTGTIPSNLTTNADMMTLELYDNPGLYGTFPEFQSMVGLHALDVHNTSLTGTIPAIWGSFPYLQYVDISSTRMACCRNQTYVDSVSNVNDLLPSFLQFDGNLTLFDTTRGVENKDLLSSVQPTDLLCGSVQRNLSIPISEWNVFNLPITSAVYTKQIWRLSPAYSWYKNCTCSVGFDKDDSTAARVPLVRTQLWCKDWFGTPWDGDCLDMNIFQCRPHAELVLSLSEQVGLGIACAFMFVVLVLSANLCMAYASKVRRLYMRARTRLQGVPKHGHMSLVVTDIEGYSDIFKRAPEVMYRALMIHNGVIRAAKFSNCGFVLEQEGDSYTLAFYDAVDAVAFCLQAQQALLAVQWPEGLDLEGQGSGAGSLSKRQPSKLQKRLSQLLASGTRRKSKPPLQSAPSATLSEGEPVVNPNMNLSQALGSGLNGLSGLKTVGETALFNGLRVRMGVVTGEVPSGTPIKSSALFQLAKVVSDFGNGGQVILDDHTYDAIKEHLTVLGAVEETGIDYRKLASGRSVWARLRSLCLDAGAPQPSAEAVVLDMGAYCQLVNNDDADLPYNRSRSPEAADDSHETKEQASNSCCRGFGFFLQRLRSGSSSSSSNSWIRGNKDSDSGLVIGSHLRQQIGEPVAAAPSSINSDSYSLALRSHQQSGSRRSAGRFSGSGSHSPPAAALGVSSMFASFSAKPNQNLFGRRLQNQLTRGGGSIKRRDYASVRLFQILAPSLAGRAHAWLNELSVKDGWVCWDMPYFDAPGSTCVPLSHVDDLSHHPSTHGSTLTVQHNNSGNAVKLHRTSSGSSSEGPRALLSMAAALNRFQMQPLMQPLPPVTMVFMAVEHPEQLVKRRRTFAPRVYGLLNKVVRDALRRCGGYLCRVQEGDLKFMVVFSNPVTALEWCLVVQEAAMYLAWPSEPVLLYPGCTMDFDERGRMVFRGPRIKMGVCEGVPKSILPDHCGRADYHGPSINMAARFMDKGAKGGQIACTAELAQAALTHWGGAHSRLEVRAARSSDGASIAAVSDPAAAASVNTQKWQQVLPPVGSVGQRNAGTDRVGQLNPQARLSSPTPFAAPQLQCRRSSDGNSGTGAAAAEQGSLCDSRSTPSITIGAPVGTVMEHSGSTGDANEPGRWGSAVGDAQSGGLGAGSLNQQLPHESSTGSGVENAHTSRMPQVERPTSPNSSSGQSPQQLGSKQQQQQAFCKVPMASNSAAASSPTPADAAGAAALGHKQSSHPTTAAATSLFKLTDVEKAPAQVEVHRLGIFTFKGGPPQQEMVQVTLSHLEGRMAFTESVRIAPSRKGQRLQKLEGRMGEPVSVHLPTLAQEYKAQLPERALTANSRVLSRSRTTVPGRRSVDAVVNNNSFTLPVVAARGTAGAGSPNHDEQNFSLPSAQWGWLARNSKSAAGPSPSSTAGKDGFIQTDPSPSPPPLAGLRVMSDISSSRGTVLSKSLAASLGTGYLVGAGSTRAGSTAIDEALEAGMLKVSVGDGTDSVQVVHAAAARQGSTMSEGTGVDKLSNAVAAAVGGLQQQQQQDTGNKGSASKVPGDGCSNTKAADSVATHTPTSSISSRKAQAGARSGGSPAARLDMKAAVIAGHNTGYLRHDSFGSVHETAVDDQITVGGDDGAAHGEHEEAIASKVGAAAAAAARYDAGNSSTTAGTAQEQDDDSD